MFRLIEIFYFILDYSKKHHNKMQKAVKPTNPSTSQPLSQSTPKTTKARESRIFFISKSSDFEYL